MTVSMSSRNPRFLMKITNGTVANAKNMCKRQKSQKFIDPHQFSL